MPTPPPPLPPLSSVLPLVVGGLAAIVLGAYLLPLLLLAAALRLGVEWLRRRVPR